MEPQIIVSISHKTFLPQLEDILDKAKNKKFRYEYFPVVVFNRKMIGISEIINYDPRHLPQFLTLYEDNDPIEKIIRYIEDLTKNDLTVAKKAFLKLRNFSIQCAERVIADLICQIMLEFIKEYKDSHIIFLIESMGSDKMLGRLGYLYLNLEKVTICSFSYKPDDMLTTVMSARTGKLLFDLHRLMSGSSGEFFSPLYPGSSEDSLIQTFFYRPDHITKGVQECLPLRVDIFTQGLLEPETQEKSEYIKKLLKNESETLPFPLKKEISTQYVKLPIGFNSIIQSWSEPMRSYKFFYNKIVNTGA